ncbi:glutaredoxin family protein [Pseudidiomarina sp. 1APP75-32.1]|uniref:Methylamine utilization protein MauE n=1 Tax=Pseudidiomarina terrestris TaxID=2820060 RepID=A0AAW7QWH6_9GAMM|nr:MULTISPECIES: MauE/DoxX family redox-associated membrane protein [unclassified Pseudidiomarina]MDN7124552.1 glutaredoxin family protein [Pseudidiomarina sp. 1APP75-32.1]MDN7129157.1 glutaredoxin family protein [Pseudidiomarina sp. 1APR75-15]
MAKQAKIYRMVMDKHICPFGMKSKDLLEREGYEVEDHHLTTREETEAFMDKHDVDTTPQTFIDGERIGGYEELRDYFGKTQPEDKFAAAYRPVIAIFGLALLMALAVNWSMGTALWSIPTAERFVAFSMALLALQKLQDVEAFTNQFLGYDLLSQRWVRYAYIYPFAEAYAGIGMLAGIWGWLVGPVAIVIGVAGSISVIKAVYIDKRELKCACVGGNSDVPLGFISLTENVMMFIAGLWMIIRASV